MISAIALRDLLLPGMWHMCGNQNPNEYEMDLVADVQGGGLYLLRYDSKTKTSDRFELFSKSEIDDGSYKFSFQPKMQKAFRGCSDLSPNQHRARRCPSAGK